MRAWILALLALAAAGCANDFPPRSFLGDLRVLALVAEPPELGVDGSTTVTATVWPVDPTRDRPAGWTTERLWSFCPYSVGSSTGYACIAPECEQPLPGEASTTVAPRPLLAACAAALGGAGQAPAGLPATPPARIETLVRHRVTVRDPAGAIREAREAVLRLPVTFPGPPALANANPVILQVEVGGEPGYLSAVEPPAGTPLPQLGPGGKLPVRVVLEAPEVTPAGILEDSVISFFTTAGRFDYDRALGPDGSVKLEGKELAGPGPAQIWVVARDLRGGQAVKGPYWVEVTP